MARIRLIDCSRRVILIGEPDNRSGYSEIAKSVKTPGFLVQRESALRSFTGVRDRIVLADQTASGSKNLKYLYRDASLTGFRATGVGIANSLFLHCLLILGMIFLPWRCQQKRPR